MNRRGKFSRRDSLKALCALGATAALGSTARRVFGDPAVTRVADADRKLLFVFTADGGASIVDAFLPVAQSEVADPEIVARINAYPDGKIGQVNGSAFRYVITEPGVIADPGQPRLLIDYALRDFVVKHGADMVVMAASASSVNHATAGRRAMNGDGINRGRTIAEAAALLHGEGLLLPSCNMARNGYLEEGRDGSIPPWARAEIVEDAGNFPLLLHGTLGVSGAPTPELVARARAVRDELDESSVFSRTFRASRRRTGFVDARRELLPQFEAEGLLQKLLLKPEGTIPGVPQSPLREQLLAHLPDLDTELSQSQAALAIAMAHYGISSASVIGTSPSPQVVDTAFSTPPLAFDYSHTTLRASQATMWATTCKTLDGVISALKQLDHLGDPSLGKMWDRSLVYVATEFGREQFRPAGAEVWGAGHSLNNGTVLISPLLNGNRVFGGVNPSDCQTYGFDTRTGEPDVDVQLKEGHVYSTIAQALGIEFPGRYDMSAVVRG